MFWVGMDLEEPEEREYGEKGLPSTAAHVWWPQKRGPLSLRKRWPCEDMPQVDEEVERRWGAAHFHD